MGYYPTDNFFSGFIVIFFIMFFLVLGIFIFQLVKGMGQFFKNEASPQLTVDAKIVSKRMDVRRRMNTDNSPATSSSYYYAAFEVESGDRMELSLSGEEYGLLAEGDMGKLTFQGTRFLGFERKK